MATQSQNQTSSPQPLSRATVSFGVALAVASIVNALLTVVKEKNPAVLAELKKLGGHHWIAHAGIIVLVFLLTGGLLNLFNGGRGLHFTANRMIQILVGGAALGGAIIVGFYLLGD
jgi:hypothetical protein